jgi:hypothetical protein
VAPSTVVHHAARFCSVACRSEGAKTDPIATITARVDRSGGPDACWPYRGYIQPNGYGSHRALGKTWYPHRVSYEVANGPIPEGLQIRHRCDNRCCCNPAHLQVGTAADNTADKVARNRQARGEQTKVNRLTAASAREVVALEGQMTQDEIARRFGVARATIQRVLTGECWSHATGRTRRH